MGQWRTSHLVRPARLPSDEDKQQMVLSHVSLPRSTGLARVQQLHQSRSSSYPRTQTAQAHSNPPLPPLLRSQGTVSPDINSYQVQATQAEASTSPIELPTFMNSTPHPRETRRFFYNETTSSVLAAMAAGHTRMQVRCTVPELNPELDVFRVGSLLECIRELSTRISADGKRVKVCVQGSMGKGVFQGLPLSLAGVAKIAAAMDWGDATEFVTFGKVGSAEVDAETDVYIVVAPQNIVGNTILTDLGAMTDAVEEAGKRIVLVNPILKDVPGHSGVMGVSGRAARMEFADSFETVYHFRLLYVSGYEYPIKGALRKAFDATWQVFKRVNVPPRNEQYQLWGEFESEPSGGTITDCFKRHQLSMEDRAKQPVAEKAKGGKWW